MVRREKCQRWHLIIVYFSNNKITSRPAPPVKSNTN